MLIHGRVNLYSVLLYMFLCQGKRGYLVRAKCVVGPLAMNLNYVQLCGIPQWLESFGVMVLKLQNYLFGNRLKACRSEYVIEYDRHTVVTGRGGIGQSLFF